MTRESANVLVSLNGRDVWISAKEGRQPSIVISLNAARELIPLLQQILQKAEAPHA